VNAYDLASSRGLSPLDVRQSFVVSYLYSLPDVHVLGEFGRQAFGGWQINGVTTLRSGSPFNVTLGSDQNLDGANNDRPDTLTNPVLSGQSRAEKIAKYFNTAAFGKPAASVPYGNTQFNSMVGPGFVNTDLSIFKSFTAYRESQLQFRAEVFNLFNNVNLNNPNAVMTSPKFGTISGASAPRIVQLALRLSF